MKIEVILKRTYDTTGDDHGHLFDGAEDPVQRALHYFGQDVDKVMTEVNSDGGRDAFVVEHDNGTTEVYV